MVINVSAKNSPSFGKVVPIKKIVFDGDSTVKYQQISMDSFVGEDTSNIDTSCSEETAKKTIQALIRILTRNDKSEANTYDNALNSMIRKTYSFVDRDYRIPAQPILSTKNDVIRPYYSNYLNYIFSGAEAQEYAKLGKNIGESRALVRDYDAPEEVIKRSKTDYSSKTSYILAKNQARLRTPIGTNLGLVIYADKVDLPAKGKNKVKTEIKIKGIDFESI